VSEAVPVTGRAQVNSYTARDGSTRPIELAYDVFGTRGRPLVLIMGIGAQRIFWDEPLCAQFVDAGFQVIRFDHRDIGQSTHLDTPVPPPFKTLARGLARLPVAAPYSLSDMAHDVIGLIDHLGIARAHVVGMSLGGMIAQHLGIEHAARIASLTTVMTSPGGRRYLPEPRAFRARFSPAPKSAAESGESILELFTTIGSTAWAPDATRLRAIGELSFERGSNPRGFLRQFAAVLKSGDRAEHLRDVKVPTLVVHGTQDPMFPLSAGRRIASLIPGATWLPITGMGHDLPAQVWPTLVRAVARHAERAEARAHAHARLFTTSAP
jgi:pimeloyl-ACP methyl ester carboxylesterase